ncbi:MAG TPA: fumarylacetoacetate hydrolase family protein [Burkholderiales bacterium]|jgi:2-keto-4-pentenoate hydratase/2-oxohepta-3-ene-1,7-dioic acid hydratase in catechol pathway|nr:fumarylacetoacetate hydrolase family protein [Burkholderiales bacterium]
MKWCRIELDSRPAYGLVEGADVILISAAPFERHERTGRRLPLASVTLLPPVDPPNFYAAGINYRAHIEWANAHHGMTLKPPQQADIGYRSANALIGSGADIVIPADSPGPVEYEGEIVAVVGKKAKHLSERDALGCIAGYTLGNDLSERTWQRSDRTLWRAKSIDTFKPMGPVVVPGIDPMAQKITVRINGRTVSEYGTKNMIFSLAHYIARMTRYITLHPGDVLWMGCDGPTVPALQAGDLVEVENDAIGVLANRVVREQPKM